MTKPRMIRKQMNFPEPLYEDIKAEAERSGMPVAVWVRMAARLELDRIQMRREAGEDDTPEEVPEENGDAVVSPVPFHRHAR